MNRAALEATMAKEREKKKSQQLVVGMASLMLGWRLRIGGFGEEPGQRNEGQQHTASRGLLEVVLSPLVFQLNPASCQLVGCAHKLRYEPCRRAVWSSWEPFLKCQGLGFLVLGGVPPEGFQVLNGFAARPLQANDTW